MKLRAAASVQPPVGPALRERATVLLLQAIQAFDRLRLQRLAAREPGLDIHPAASSNLAVPVIYLIWLIRFMLFTIVCLTCRLDFHFGYQVDILLLLLLSTSIW